MKKIRTATLLICITTITACQQNHSTQSNTNETQKTHNLQLTDWKKCFDTNKEKGTWCLPTQPKKSCPPQILDKLTKQTNLMCSNKSHIPAPEWVKYPASCFGALKQGSYSIACVPKTKPDSCTNSDWSQLQSDNGILLPPCTNSNSK